MSVHRISPSTASALGRQLRFLMRVAELVPRLLAALDSGHVETRQKLGQRRLADGRTVELWLVARAPRPDSAPLIRRQDSMDRGDGSG